MSSIGPWITARLSVNAVYGAVLFLVFAVALCLRVVLPYDSVFVGDWVRFGLNDPWYHMRLVENLVQHFPERIAFDPFTHFPYGQEVPFAPFFDLLLGFIIWVVGLGSPTQHTIEVVGAYFPAVLGALVTVPVFFIAKELFNRNAGLLAAALIAILPGEFLFRSLLGFTDHHVAEVLFSATAALFFIMAIRRAAASGTTFGDVWRRNRPAIGKPLIYAALAGLMLGLYVLSWVGGLLLAFIVAAYLIIQYVADHLWGRSTDYLCIVGVPVLGLPLLLLIPFLSQLRLGSLEVASLLIGVLALCVASATSRAMTYKNVRRAYYPVALVVLGLAALGIFYAVQPGLLHSMMARFSVFTPGTAARTISEVQSLVYQQGSFSLSPAWHYFTTSFFIAFVSFGLLIYAAIRERSADKTFFIVWGLIILVATLSQRRFAYYYAVNVALLSGYFCWRVLDWSGLRGRRAAAEPPAHHEDRRHKKAKKRAKKKAAPRKPLTGYLGGKYLLPALAILAVFFGVLYPNFGDAVSTADNPSGPDEAWHSSLLWMRENTPDPFGDPTFYYEPYAPPPPGESYDYPDPAYGVMSWWDYGHWITRIAHRLPHANPFQAGVHTPASFFTAQDASSAGEIMDSNSSRYVIIDYPMVTSKFYAMPAWLGQSETDYFDTYYQRTQDGQMQGVRLYHPAYYRSMGPRLYNFGGEAVTPQDSTWVIRYEENTDPQGNTYKLVTDVANGGKAFATYEEAQAYLADQTAPGYRIVGNSPFVSPVPLEKLEHFEAVYDSPQVVSVGGDRTAPTVRIFEYTP